MAAASVVLLASLASGIGHRRTLPVQISEVMDGESE